MATPLVRSIAARVRAVQMHLLHRWVLRRRSHPIALPEQPALVVAPHPDDETFACGGLIALKRRAGIPVDIVVVTDGSQAHASLSEQVQIVASRQREFTEATALLGVEAERLHFLDGPDGRMPQLDATQRDELIERLAALIRGCGAKEIYVPHRRDRHPDHEAVYQLTVEAIERAGVDVELMQYPVWILWRRTPLQWRLSEITNAGRLDVRAAQEVKDRAIAAYRSQLSSFPPGFMGQFANGDEYFWSRRAVAQLAVGNETSLA